MTTLCLIVIVILILFLCVLVPDAHKKKATQETTEVSWVAEPGEILQEVPNGFI